jgi:hypothetical protein
MARLLIGLMLAAASMSAHAADPLDGKWQLNVANSMYDPGPAPKSVVRNQTLKDDTYTLVSEITEADGSTRTLTFSAKLDGKDYPVTGSVNADTIALKRLDERTIEFTQKKGGKEVVTGKHTVSEDGTELEISAKGTSPKGEEFANLMVFDKAKS